MRSPDRRPQALPDRLALRPLPLHDDLPAAMIGLLIAGGVIVLLAQFPIVVSDWLPRSVVLLIGAIMVTAAIVGLELRALILPLTFYSPDHDDEGQDDDRHEEAGPPEGPAPV